MSRPQGLVGGAISLQGRPTLAWRPQSQGRWTRTGRGGGPREPQPRHQSPPSQLPEAVVTTGGLHGSRRVLCLLRKCSPRPQAP